jgi:hypothetical protein
MPPPATAILAEFFFWIWQVVLTVKDKSMNVLELPPLDKEPPVSPKDLCVLSSTQACRWATYVFGRYKEEVMVGEKSHEK